ncbi:MAG: hypothetical protein WCO55_00445 [Candidatus Falkowbacteria bacterium]
MTEKALKRIEVYYDVLLKKIAKQAINEHTVATSLIQELRRCGALEMSGPECQAANPKETFYTQFYLAEGDEIWKGWLGFDNDLWLTTIEIPPYTPGLDLDDPAYPKVAPLIINLDDIRARYASLIQEIVFLALETGHIRRDLMVILDGSGLLLPYHSRTKQFRHTAYVLNYNFEHGNKYYRGELSFNKALELIMIDELNPKKKQSSAVVKWEKWKP